MNEGIWDLDFIGGIDCKMVIIVSKFWIFKNWKMILKIVIIEIVRVIKLIILFILG